MALGHLRVRPGKGPRALAAEMAGMEAFTGSRCWRLGEVFVDDDPLQPLVAWASVTVAARRPLVATVLVPDVPGLRPSSLVPDRSRARCARKVGTPLLLAPPVTAPGPTFAGPPIVPSAEASGPGGKPTGAWLLPESAAGALPGRLSAASGWPRGLSRRMRARWAW